MCNPMGIARLAAAMNCFPTRIRRHVAVAKEGELHPQRPENYLPRMPMRMYAIARKRIRRRQPFIR
jgi:hypothetical protein